MRIQQPRGDAAPAGSTQVPAGVNRQQRGLLRAAAQLALGTFVSRILGLGRDMSRAWLFGTGTAADAFTVAFRLPNLLRALFAEGAMSAAFVPVFARTLRAGDREDLERFVHSFGTLLLIVLVGVSLAGILLAPTVVPWIVHGFQDVPGKVDLTVRLTQILFPYIVLIALATLAMAVLNTLGHFRAPAFAPSVLNLCMIVGVLFVAPRLSPRPEVQIYGLAAAVIVGGILQGLVQLPPLLALGIRPRLRFDFSHPAIRQVAFLMLPGVFGIAVQEVNVFVDTLLASLLEPGSVAALEYGQRVMQLPLGVFAVALGTAILPTLSRQAAEGDAESLRDTYGFGLRMTWLILVPATVLLIVLARPILTALFSRGAFAHASSLEMTIAALVFFSIGLCAYGSVKTLVALYYAHQDTRYPVRCAAAAMVTNIALNLILMHPLRLGGLALATSLASFLNVFLLVRGIPRRLKLRHAEGLTSAALRLLAAGAACGATAWMLQRFLPGPLLARLAAALAGAVAVDLLVVHLLGGGEPRALGQILARRFRRS